MRKQTVRIEQRVEFLGEQDGPPEPELKAAISAVLVKFQMIERAYLARLGFGPDQPKSVALCLAPPSANKTKERSIVEDVLKVFAHQFSRDVFLDVMFPTKEQETDLARVCRPFYERGVGATE